MKRSPSHKIGFTLVEVMIVVAIIAILAAIAIPNLFRMRTSANEAKAQAVLSLISKALENYYAINTQYPTDPNDLIGTTPPYLTTDYFTGTHDAYAFTPTLAAYSYTVTAVPSAAGMSSYTLATGGTISENP